MVGFLPAMRVLKKEKQTARRILVARSLSAAPCLMARGGLCLASIGTSGTCQRLLAARILHAGSKNTARWQQDFCPLAAR